jgi:hypothetical protein
MATAINLKNRSRLFHQAPLSFRLEHALLKFIGSLYAPVIAFAAFALGRFCNFNREREFYAYRLYLTIDADWKVTLTEEEDTAKCP